VTSFSDYLSFACLCNGRTCFVGSDDFGNGWFSIASTSITTWMSHPSSSFTTIWGKNVPESSQFSDATGSGDGTLANGQNATNSSVTVFTLAQLRAATYNFRSDMVLGKGGFGDVYKGWLKEKLPPRGIKKTAVAIKKLDSFSMQGLKEWKVCGFPNFVFTLCHTVILFYVVLKDRLHYILSLLNLPRCLLEEE